MEKHVYRVQAQYIFAGVFEVVSTTREEAWEKIERHCGVVMGGIHSTLLDEEINCAFDIHPEKRIGGITEERE